MQDIVPGPLSQKRRNARQQQRLKGLLVGAGFVLGALIGWLLLGWWVWPSSPSADPATLADNARSDYVELVVESWDVTHDLASARDRLNGFAVEDLATILGDLETAAQLGGQTARATRISRFASAFGIPLTTNAAVLGAGPDPARSGPTPALPPLTRIAIDAGVPRLVRAAIEQLAHDENAVLVALGDHPQLTVTTQAQPESILLAERFYVVVDRFATLRTDVTLAQVRALWQGQATADGISGLLITGEVADGLSGVLGPSGKNIKTVTLDALNAQLWSDANTLGLVPFDQLTPHLAALRLDGQNVLAHDLPQYPLVVRTFVVGPSNLAQRLAASVRRQLPRTNRDPERITTVIMTGTTALARTAAIKIDEKKDPAYPARLIGPTLAAADITHVSNEIPFVDTCTPVLNTMTFCSRPSYMATFKLAGVDIVGLTGNHLLDYGAAPFLKTLDAYNAAGIRYYGGGRNAEDASKTLLLADHGNRIAFIGVNAFGPPGVWATAGQPGAQRYDANVLQKEIAEARKQADVVFVELQGDETYDYQPNANNQIRFRATLDAGADVVTGVQAHQPQGIELSADGRRIILYGLGNLFFDQMFQLSVQQELIARHTIYQGHLIQTELLTAMLEDYVQPRWMTVTERQALLRSVFAASYFK